MNYHLSDQSYPLPEAVAAAVSAGQLKFAETLIDSYLAKDIPQALRDRLLLEKEIMERRRSHYIYSYEEAEKLLEENFPKYRKGMLESFIDDGLLDWGYVDGELRLEHMLVDNAAKRCDVLKEEGKTDPDLARRDDFIALLEEKKVVETEIKARITMSIKDGSVLGKVVHVNLPLVKPVDGRIWDVKVLESSASLISMDGEDAPMRTAVFEKVLEKGDEFSLTFSYKIKEAERAWPEDGGTVADGMEEFLHEELPHIRFTPYLRAMAEEITKGKTTLKEKAEAIYFWLTSHVRYSFVRPYATINNISEYAASSLKGDCGVQALLFITLCRISGIPATWESGWYVTPDLIGPHDWAKINLSGNWYPVDCSFGGGGYREGNYKRQKHYFGSLDVFRMVANTAGCRTLTGKLAHAQDPTDNQRGEAECEGRTIYDFDTRLEVLSFGSLN